MIAGKTALHLGVLLFFFVLLAINYMQGYLFLLPPRFQDLEIWHLPAQTFNSQLFTSSIEPQALGNAKLFPCGILFSTLNLNISKQ